MRIVSGATASRNRRGVQAAGGKFQHGLNLLSRYMKLLDDLLDARTGLKILEHRRYRHTRAPEYPGAAPLARNALHCRTLRPIKGSHVPASPNLSLLPRQKTAGLVSIQQPLNLLRLARNDLRIRLCWPVRLGAGSLPVPQGPKGTFFHRPPL